MTWTTQAYCTLADVKMALAYLQGTQDDDYLSSLILQAQADIDREVGYAFQQDGTVDSPATRFYDGEGQERLFIDDLITLTQVLESNSSTIFSANATWEEVTASPVDITADVILKPNNTIPAFILQRKSQYTFEPGVQNYQVSGIFGQPILAGQVYPGVPNDIMRATIRLVTHYYMMRSSSYADIVQDHGGVRVRYTKQIPPDVLEIVQRYKRTLFIGRWN
jgi:hypothetical protein